MVRFTNKDIICQIISAELEHDRCLMAAYAHELPRYGLQVGLTNYSAAYCVGLLCARRLMTKLGLDEIFEATLRAEKEDFDDEYLDGNFEFEYDTRKPFYALLDVGLHRASTGARLFGALKGACDGGIDITHSDRRFPGTKWDNFEESYVSNPEKHRGRIFGDHIRDYMKLLMESKTKQTYETRFSRYIAAGIGPDDLRPLYEKVHRTIVKDPMLKRPVLKLGRFKTRTEPLSAKPTKRDFRKPRMSREEKADHVRQKLLKLGKKSLSEWMDLPEPELTAQGGTLSGGVKRAPPVAMVEGADTDSSDDDLL